MSPAIRPPTEDGRDQVASVLRTSLSFPVEWLRTRAPTLPPPDLRRGGFASAALLQILPEARERGIPLSTLYPVVLSPYRKLGDELAGTFNEHRPDLDAIPADLGTGRATRAILSCFQGFRGVGLSSAFSGYLHVGDAVELGLLDGDDPAGPALEQLFSGPEPWCPFLF